MPCATAVRPLTRTSARTATTTSRWVMGSFDDELADRRLGATGLEPVDALADQVEPQRIAARPLRHRYVDGHVGLAAAADGVRQEGPGPVTLDRRAVRRRELCPEADVAATVGRGGGERPLREVADARVEAKRRARRGREGGIQPSAPHRDPCP